jgi:hypothetical protein
LRVKEPTTLEAKRGNILYCMKDWKCHLLILKRVVFFLFLTPVKMVLGFSYGNCEGNSYPESQVRFVRWPFVQHKWGRKNVTQLWW